MKLEQNYRSTQTILSAANGLISHNRTNREKNLWTDAGEGEKITVAELDDEHGEARYVAGEIEELVDNGKSSATRSRSSTGPTPTAGCWRTSWSATSCPTR